MFRERFLVEGGRWEGPTNKTSRNPLVCREDNPVTRGVYSRFELRVSLYSVNQVCVPKTNSIKTPRRKVMEGQVPILGFRLPRF